MGIITAEALCTNPYNARMEISDLGASEAGVVLQPSSTIFNATMLVAGAIFLAGGLAGFGSYLTARHTAEVSEGVASRDGGALNRALEVRRT